ncbi:hypothetical protein J4G37_30020, partial [Microvirga sp. 3-52]|nr:hypothetical protein [Microvirga sp. 3-52]
AKRAGRCGMAVSLGGDTPAYRIVRFAASNALSMQPVKWPKSSSESNRKPTLRRHHRPCAGDPDVKSAAHQLIGMAGTGPAMTAEARSSKAEAPAGLTVSG